MVVQVLDGEVKKQIAGDVLGKLSDWFGLPESAKRYIEESAGMPFWAWYDGGEDAEKQEVSGFLSMKETSPDTAEVFVMGVLPGRHRQGIGRELYFTLEQYAREQGYSFVQVKTVQSGHYEEYDRTNAFYRAMGFSELECLPTLWDAWNPCQIYVKYIGGK